MPRTRHLHRSRRLLAGLMLFTGAMLLLAPSAQATEALAGQGAAQGTCGPDDAYLSVLQVEGRLDAVLVDFVASQVSGLEDTCAVGLLLQLDSNGVMGEGGDIDALLAGMHASGLPVEVWVGPSGSRATEEATQLLAAADRIGLSPGSHVEVTSDLVAARGVDETDLGTVRLGDRIGPERALELGLVDSDAPVLGDFVVEMDNVETRVVGEGEDARVEPATPAVFAKLPLTGQLMHTVASPAVAYLLFVIGLALLLFELYAASIGIAGMVGAVCLVLGSYGLASLPTSPLGVGLILLAMFGYAVDVQTGIPRVWTGIATVAFIAGSLLLFDGLTLSWITLMVAFVGMTLFMLRGAPVMVRSRFSTSTIDRGWLVGEQGIAATALAPAGTVTVRDAPWPAEVAGSGTLEPGQELVVTGVDGFTLAVEPADGTAPQGEA